MTTKTRKQDFGRAKKYDETFKLRSLVGTTKNSYIVEKFVNPRIK